MIDSTGPINSLPPLDLPLAFTLGNPLLLWGFLLLAIPWLLHLLTKRQYRSTEWAAMRFLLEAMRKNSRRIRLEHLILLLVRTALLGLVVLGLARPLWTSASSLLGGIEPIQRVIVVDTSYSLGFEHGGSTLFTRVKTLMRELVSKSRQGDAFQLVTLAQSGPEIIIGEPAFQAEDVLGEVERLQLTQGSANLLETLNVIGPLLEKCPEIARKQIVIYTDLQKSTWKGSPTDREEIRETLKALTSKARIHLIDVGVPESENRSVTSLSLAENLIVSDLDVEIRGTLRSYGPSNASACLVELWNDGQLVSQQQVSLTPGTDATVSFPYRFSTGGWHRLRLKIPSDRLPLDDERTLGIEVKSVLRVLCVNGTPGVDERDSAAYYLKLALSPPSSDSSVKSLIQSTEIEANELPHHDLHAYDMLFFCNVPAFDEGEALSIRQYLESGGAVVWGMGDRVQPENYQRLLSNVTPPLFPAPLAERQGDAKGKGQVFHLSTADLSHPILKLFQGNPASGLGTTPVFEYFRIGKNRVDQSSELTPPRVVLAFSNGDPAILETRVGRGTSFLLTTTFDESWSNFAIWPSFVPFTQELVRYGAVANQPDLTVGLTQSLTLANPKREPLEIRKPDGVVVPFAKQEENSESVAFDQTDLPGLYEVNGSGGNLKHLFAVTLPPEEADLEKLTRGELDQSLLAGIPFDYQTEGRTDSILERTGTIRTIEPARWLIAAGLYLILVELLMSWNFRWGVSLLFPPLIPFWLWRSRS